MSNQVAVLVSFVIYLAFFGWLGWRRGSRRELIVTIVAVVAWLLLQERGEIIVNIANLGGSTIAFAQAGGFGSNQNEALSTLSATPQLITSDSRPAFLFVVWVAIFVFTYALTNTSVADKDSRRNSWAIFLGMINGLFFAIAFLPSMVALFTTDGDLPEPGIEIGLAGFIRSGLQLVWDSINSLWSLVAPLGNLALLLMLTLILVLAVTTIRGGARAKS